MEVCPSIHLQLDWRGKNTNVLLGTVGDIKEAGDRDKSFSSGKFSSFQCNWSSSCLNKNPKMLQAVWVGLAAVGGMLTLRVFCRVPLMNLFHNIKSSLALKAVMLISVM